MNILFLILVILLISGGALAAMHGFTHEILIDCEPNKSVHWAFVAAGLAIWAVGIVVLVLAWKNINNKILKIIAVVILLTAGAFALMYGFSKQVISKCTEHSTTDWAVAGVGALIWILGIVVFVLVNNAGNKRQKEIEAVAAANTKSPWYKRFTSNRFTKKSGPTPTTPEEAAALEYFKQQGQSNVPPSN